MSSIREEYTLKKEGDFWVTTVKDKPIGFRKWTWGEKNEASAKCTHLNPLSGLMDYDSQGFNEQVMVKTVYKFEGDKFVPFTVEEIRAMDGQVGERLFQITQKLNFVQMVEAQNL